MFEKEMEDLKRNLAEKEKAKILSEKVGYENLTDEAKKLLVKKAVEGLAKKGNDPPVIKVPKKPGGTGMVGRRLGGR